MVICLERGAHLHTAAHSECDGQLCVCVCVVCVCGQVLNSVLLTVSVMGNCVCVCGLCVWSGVEQCAGHSECDG